MSHLLSFALIISSAHSIFFWKDPLLLRKEWSKAEVSATCSLFVVQTPGACRQINKSFRLTFSFSLLLYLCCYSLLMISSTACFSASNIFVLCYFELLVISKVSEHCPVQHLLKYQFLGRFWIVSTGACFSQESISVLFAPLSVEMFFFKWMFCWFFF